MGAWFQRKMNVCYGFNSVREAEEVGVQKAICICLDLKLQRVVGGQSFSCGGGSSASRIDFIVDNDDELILGR